MYKFNFFTSKQVDIHDLSLSLNLSNLNDKDRSSLSLSLRVPMSRVRFLKYDLTHRSSQSTEAALQVERRQFNRSGGVRFSACLLVLEYTVKTESAGFKGCYFGT